MGRRAWLAGSVCLGALSLTACSGGTTVARLPAAAPPALPTPMAGSVPAAGGTWAVIPMGHLDQPRNTFWQLLHRSGGGAWTDDVAATATATNGGLLLAPAGSTLVVGVRASQRLRFTPLISTGDEASSWADGLVDAAVAARPAALAALGPGRALALVGPGGGSEVLAADGSLSSWRRLTSRAALAHSAATRSCALGRLTAVGYFRGRPSVGATCGRPGTVGLMVDSPDGWRLAGIGLPAALRTDRTEVLTIVSVAGRTTVLSAVAGPAGPELVAFSAGPSGRWATSAPYLLGRATVRALAFGPGQQLDVLTGPAGGGQRLAVVRPGGPSRLLPPPPPGTATVAAGPAGTLDAMAGAGDTLTVWQLDRGARSWVRRQRLHVPIPYGSS